MGIRTDRFMFDGKNSYTDFNLLVCNIGKEEDDTTSAGSKFTKKTHYSHTLKKWIYYGYEYEEHLTFTFDVIKNPCKTSNEAFTSNDIQSITNWLMRTDGDKEFYLPDKNIRFFGTCTNIDIKSVGEKKIGLSITLETNAPFGYSDLKECELSNSSTAQSAKTIYSYSTEEGKNFVDIKIECFHDTNVIIKNDYGELTINNCVKGEVITINGETKVITSSVGTHKIYNDFNFQYLYIDKGNNYFEISGDDTFYVWITYRDIYKVGV